MSVSYLDIGFDSFIERRIEFPTDFYGLGTGGGSSGASISIPQGAISDGGIEFSQTTLAQLVPNQDMQSSNFITGSAGWQIQGDGSVEFNNGIFRGALVAATIDIGGSDATSLHVDIDGNMWMGAATFNLATNPFAVSNVGSLRARDGIIGGFTITSTTLTATNFNVVSGAANIARLEVGSGANIGGINSPAAGGDIVFWAGDTFANRATAPFRVTAAGVITGTGNTNIVYTVPPFFCLYSGAIGSPVIGWLTYSDDSAYIVHWSGTTIFVYDATPGGDLENRNTTSDFAGITSIQGIVKIGGFLYVKVLDGVTDRVLRYDAQNLAGGSTTMTIVGTALPGGHMISGGTDLWINTAASRHVFLQYTISGTTLTSSSTVTNGATSAFFTFSAMDRRGNFYGCDTTLGTQLWRRHNSSGVLQITQTNGFSGAGTVDSIHTISGIPYYTEIDTGTADSYVAFHRVALLPTDIFS